MTNEHGLLPIDGVLDGFYGHLYELQYHPNFEDPIEDRVREAKNGDEIRTIIRESIGPELNEYAAEVAVRMMAYIIDSKKPKLAADCFGWITGLYLRNGKSLPELAKRNGISKQAFCQAANKAMERIGIAPARAMRKEVARANMAKAYRENHRPLNA